MKKMSKNVLFIVIGILVAFTIDVAAEAVISSGAVSYSNTTVSAALDELFSAVDINQKIGTTDISTIGDGTITGAVSNINSNLTTKAIIEPVTLESVFGEGINTDLISKVSLIRGYKIYSNDRIKTGVHYELLLNVTISTETTPSVGLFYFENITPINYQIVGTLIPRGSYAYTSYDLFLSVGQTAYSPSELPAGSYVLRMSFIATT